MYSSSNHTYVWLSFVVYYSVEIKFFCQIFDETSENDTFYRQIFDEASETFCHQLFDETSVNNKTFCHKRFSAVSVRYKQEDIMYFMKLKNVNKREEHYVKRIHVEKLLKSICLKTEFKLFISKCE